MVGAMRGRARFLLVALIAFVLGACGGGAGGAAENSTRYRLRTHCGIVSARVDGELWLASPPLTASEGNPPAEWDDNANDGEFIILDEGSAEFRADAGPRARFVKASSGAPDPNEGCE